MPKRPRSHTLEDQSRRAFAALLPDNWVIRPLVSDYGLDEQIEVFDEKGLATGLMFLVQVKATDKTDLASALKLSFPIETLDYYRGLELPVMIVRFHAPTRKFYWRWFHEFRERPAAGQKSITLTIPVSAVWNEKTPEEISKSLQMFRQIKSTRCPHPIIFELAFADSDIGGLPSSLLRMAMNEVAQPLASLLQFTDKIPIGAHPKVVISKAALSVDLAGLRSVTLASAEPYSKARVTNSLPHDVLTSVAFVLAKVGHLSEASEIAYSHLDRGTLVAYPEIYFELIGAMARSRRVPDALRLASRILDLANGAQLAQWLLIITRIHCGTLQDPEIEYLKQLMLKLIERARDIKDSGLLATTHYNLGNLLRGLGGQNLRSAFAEYRLAAKSEPGYRQRSYFWKEMAGVLYLMNRFKWAAAAYQKAFEIDREPICLALGADSLMSLGKYADALQLFDQYVNLASEPDAEWYLKDFMLSHLVTVLGIREQKRDSKAADKLADVSSVDQEEKLPRLMEAIHLDALSSFAWFNVGAGRAQAGEFQSAFEGYLFAAICWPGDTEAFVKAMAHGLSLPGKNPVISIVTASAIRMAYRRNGQMFLDELRKFIEQQDPRFPSEVLMKMVAEIVKGINRTNRMTTLRMVGQGADYEVVSESEKPN